MRSLVLISALFLAGCGFLTPALHIERVEVPIPVPCNIVPPKKPAMPFTDAINNDTSGPSTNPLDDMFRDIKRMLAEIENRKGYESELEAAVKSCNSK